MELKVKLMDGAPLPKHAKPGDAGLDLTAREDVRLEQGETKMVGTGVAVEIPEGYVGLVLPRSGLGSKGVTLSNCVGVIDSGYRGEIKAALHNNNPFHIERHYDRYQDRVERNWEGIRRVSKGDRICQLVVVPFATCECVQVDELGATELGEGGFGSTGMGVAR